jgi:hypothetical protein
MSRREQFEQQQPEHAAGPGDPGGARLVPRPAGVHPDSPQRLRPRQHQGQQFFYFIVKAFGVLLTSDINFSLLILSLNS